jgi:putative iron-dependent peroxidase
VTGHGTKFVGFSRARASRQTMLESMAGLVTGTRDALTRYTRPLTGACCFVPSSAALLRLPATLQ